MNFPLELLIETPMKILYFKLLFISTFYRIRCLEKKKLNYCTGKPSVLVMGPPVIHTSRLMVTIGDDPNFRNLNTPFPNFIVSDI